MKSTNRRALKAGMWYVICNFISKGLYMITTPIYTRMLSADDYGITVTYNSWVTLLFIIATLDLYSCIQLSKAEFDGKSEEFLSAILCLSSISIVCFYVLLHIVLHFQPDLLGVPNILVDILFVEILFRNAYNLLQTHHKAHLRYKEFVIMTILIAILEQGLSVILVCNLKHNQYLGRILGTVIPFCIFGLAIMIIILHRGKTIYSKEYWQFGLRVSVPLIPHHLSGNILNHFDRIIINSYIGAGYAALYSLASNYALIVQIAWSSLNSAWTPWFYEKMKDDDISEIRKFVKPYTILFAAIVVVAVAFGPEAILILGGEKYADSRNVVPAFVFGIFFQFLYSLYSNIEFYYKKTSRLAVWTVIAATVNVVLNYLFVPRFGYVAAAYTTLVGYLLLYLLHYRTAKKLENRDLYGRKFLISVTTVTLILVILFYFLYRTIIARYVFLFVIISAAVLFTLKNKKMLRNILQKEVK